MSANLDLFRFYKRFKGEKFIIGESQRGKPIYCFEIYKSDYPVIINQYSIHAREYITTYLAIEQIKDFYKRGKCGRIFFIPMLNPDGVEICQTQKPLYKANANGVDLNVNFPARWGTGEKNTLTSGDENFIGKYPFSERETQVLRDFTLKVKPDITVSYHSKGEEIYYQFFQDEKREKRDYLIAKAVAEETGYQIKKTPFSAGGYKDWCIEHLKIPALTIEVGRDNLSHPIGKEHLKEIYKKCKGINESIICALEKLCK